MAKAPNWTNEEVEYIKSVWEDYSVNIEEIVNKLNRKRQTISSKARKLGLYRGYNSVFSKEEIEVLKDVYPHMSNKEIQSQIFPDKTIYQINSAGGNHKIKKTEECLRKIKVQTANNNLKYIEKTSGENHPCWIEKPYLECDNCGKEIIKKPSKVRDTNFCSRDCLHEYKIGKSIGQNNPNWNGGYSTVKEYCRLALRQWKFDSMKNCNYKCIISGGEFDVVHHIIAFDLIFRETLNDLGFADLNNITLYSEEDIIKLRSKIIENHYKHCFGVCLKNEYHDMFHIKYGKKNFTKENWKEFYKDMTGKDCE